MRNLNAYAKICMEELDNIGIEYGNVYEFVPNNRAKKRWGQCKKNANGYSININAILLDENKSSEEGLKDTIIHELLHSCEGCMNHGNEWKALADKVNRAYGYHISRCSSAESKGVSIDTNIAKAPAYAVRCKKCGQIIERERMSKVIQHPECFLCGRCHGKLERIR